jgi:probable rRNA maturation factor
MVPAVRAAADPMPAAAIDIRIDAPAWRSAVADVRKLVRRAARAAIAATPVGAELEISVTLTDDAAMRRLNREWRGKDRPTNVLSFPFSDLPPAGAPRHLGDVILALETSQREAREQRKTLADHLAHLVVHGVLHLMGFDHERAAEARAMEWRETAILATLGIADPYRVAAR